MIASHDPEEEVSENRAWKSFGKLLIIAGITAIIVTIALVIALIPYFIN